MNIIKEMQIKATMKCHYMPTRMALSKEPKYQKLERTRKNRDPYTFLVESQKTTQITIFEKNFHLAVS